MEQTAAIIFVMSMLVSGVSFAEDVSYTYVRLGYVNTEIDVGPINVDGDGLELDGSFGFVNNAFAFGTYSDLDFDFDIDASLLEIGGGYHHRITPKIDLVGRLGYVRADIDRSFSAALPSMELVIRLRTPPDSNRPSSSASLNERSMSART